MGELVEFRAVVRETPQRRDVGKCDIIIFPGVRIERWSDGSTAHGGETAPPTPRGEGAGPHRRNARRR
jgi:hypothetical protein